MAMTQIQKTLMVCRPKLLKKAYLPNESHAPLNFTINVVFQSVSKSHVFHLPVLFLFN